MGWSFCLIKNYLHIGKSYAILRNLEYIMKKTTALMCTVFAACAFAGTYEPPSAAVSKINSYRSYSELTKAAGSMDLDQYAYNMTTWQISNGGFYKAMASKYVNPYAGGQKSEWRSASGGDLATIDNDATVQEMRLLAVRYKATTNSSYKSAFKTSFNKAVNFLLTMQRSTGGLPQVWPKRGNYSDHVTLNDDAMVRALVTMMDIANKTSPFDGDITDDATRAKMNGAIEKAIAYLIKAQIKNNEVPTVWCAQHDTATYVPRPARAYELESKSGKESAGVVWFLMNWPNQTPEIQNSVKSAINWYRKTRVKDLVFEQKKGAFTVVSGKSLWYRFYEVNSDDYFFCDRDGVSTKTQDITKISEERRTGYQWASDYGSALLSAESAYLAALEAMNAVEVEPVAECGGAECSTVLQGEDFLTIDGKKESDNKGFLGEGYANVENAVGSYVTYGVTATETGKYTLYVRYANGGSAARDFSISSGEKVLFEKGSMDATGTWTTWKTIAVEVELSKGYHELAFTSLGKDGMANIDAIGWLTENLKVGKVELPESSSSIESSSSSDETAIASLKLQALKIAVVGNSLVLKNLPRGEFQITIHDVQGNMVKNISSRESSVNLNQLKPGYYLITVRQGNWILARTSAKISR